MCIHKHTYFPVIFLPRQFLEILSDHREKLSSPPLDPLFQGREQQFVLFVYYVCLYVYITCLCGSIHALCFIMFAKIHGHICVSCSCIMFVCVVYVYY